MSENLEYYKVFYYAARFGSLTMAGTELSISQPAVSQALKQLESALMVKLFVRSARGIRLTPEGEILYRHVKAGYEQILLGEKKLSSMLRLDYGELRIGASDMTLKFYLLPLLEAYHEKFPGIKVTVTNAPTPETLDLLRQGKIDFGAVSMPFQAGGELSVTPVKEIEDVFVAVYPVQKPYAGFAGAGKAPCYFSGGKNQHQKLSGWFSGKKRDKDLPGI